MGFFDTLGDIGSGISNIYTLGGAGKQSDASQAAAQEQLSSQQGLQNQVMGMFPGLIGAAQPTAGELDNMTTYLNNSQSLYAQQSQQLQGEIQLQSQINPAIGAAGVQALAMLNGKSAPVLAPMQNQIANQRAQLVQSLQNQYGPGYATSSAGMQALNQFDQNAQMTMAQAQQSYEGQLMGQAIQGNPNISNQMAQMGQSSAQSATTYGNLSNTLQQRQMGVYGQQMGALMATSPTQYQGADQVANQMMGAQNSKMGGNLFGFAFQGMNGIMSGSGQSQGGGSSGGGGGGMGGGMMNGFGGGAMGGGSAGGGEAAGGAAAGDEMGGMASMAAMAA